MAPEDSKEDRIAAAAERALAEAEARSKTSGGEAKPLPVERGGRGGPEPTRFGDWEKDGITSDF